MTQITTVGVDLSKEVIVVCAADSGSRTVYFKQLGFAGFAQWAANLPPCVIGMEACSSAHHWTRFLTLHGHAARLMAAEHVKPFRMSQGAKNERNDAQAVARRAQQLCGIGTVTASALVATISNSGDFRNGRQLAAWDGLVPKQFSTGGKTVLGPITRRGDSYLRGLLTQGARSALQSALKRKPEKRSRLQQWIVALHGRVGYHKTLVAIANKYLRILWAMLTRKEDFNADAWLRHADRT